MRIGKRGRRSSGSGKDAALHQGREARARTFRNMHHVGETVTGRFMKRDDSGHAWVSFDGLPLLAKIDGTPRPGSLLHFTIQTLSPDIVLKQSSGGSASGGPGQAQSVVDFDSARHAFETVARKEILAQSPRLPEGSTLPKRRNALFEALPAEARQLYLAVATGQAAVNTHLASTGSSRFFYLPWLLPALRCDLIVRRETKEDGTPYHELALGLEPPDLGPVQVRLLSRPGRSAVRVLLERTEHIPLANAVLTALGQTMGDGVTLLGADKPLQYAHGGVLSLLLAPDPHKLSGLGN